MSALTMVDAFFDAYARRRSRSLPADSGEFSEAEDRASLKEPSLSPRDIDELQRDVAHPVPASYRHFLTSRSFVELDLPWIVFPSADAQGLQLLKQSRAQVPAALAPFAFDTDQVGLFCFDSRGAISDEPSVCVYFDEFDRERNGTFERHAVISRVASSFSHLLSVLRVILESPIVPWVRPGASPTPEQRQLLRSMKAADPDGFGGPSWDEWWRPYAVGYDER